MKQQSDLTIILCCCHKPAAATIEEYKAVCKQFIIVCRYKYGSLNLNREFETLRWTTELGKVAALNEAVLRAKGTHILWVEDGERISELPDLKKNTFCAARVVDENAAEELVENRQVRLFPNPDTDTPVFTGFEIPDIYRAIQRLNWKQSERTFTIKRNKPLFPSESIQQEVECVSDFPVHSFWKALWAAENGDFNFAVKCFEKTLKENDLMFWNRLAALNGLANALKETHRLEKAKQIAGQSLQISSNQRAPYLTLYQYHNLKGESERAYRILDRYRQALTDKTEANWDVFLPESQAAFLMAEISFRQGWHEQAYQHYEDFYEFNDGIVSQPILEKLFLYAVELQQREKAICFFEALFGDDFPDNLDEDQAARLGEALSLFTDKGWYDVAGKMYRKLLAYRPQDEALRNGCIRTLIKNDEVKKAQALL